MPGKIKSTKINFDYCKQTVLSNYIFIIFDNVTQRNITVIRNWVASDVSSTIIRRLIGRGESVKYLIDDLVYDYIKQHDLFRSKK